MKRTRREFLATGAAALVTGAVPGQSASPRIDVRPPFATTQQSMRRYTAGFSGNPDLPQRWSTVAEYLALFDRHTALNVACLVPNGCVRLDTIGLEPRRATADELRAMRRRVHDGL